MASQVTDLLLVLCTCSDEAEAQRIATALVEDRFAACVNIVTAVQSIYRWQGAVEKATEALLVIKTTQARFSALRDFLTSVHSYDLPEILAIPIVEGSDRYLEWVRQQV